VPLTREQVLGAKPAAEDVECPELGGPVRVCEMVLAQREVFEMAVSETADDGQRVTKTEGFRANLLIATVMGEDGAPLFGPEDFALVQQLPATAADRLAQVAIRLNGLEKNAVEDAVKN